MTVDVAKPSAAEQRAAWLAAVGDEGAQVAPDFAAQFNLNLDAIDEIARAAHTQSGDTPLPDRLWDACLAATRPRLDTLAQRIEPKVAWDDIVLPALEKPACCTRSRHQVAQRSTVHEYWGFVRKMNRGLGISALFAGDSGTGKTMAAEVIANELRLNSLSHRSFRRGEQVTSERPEKNSAALTIRCGGGWGSDLILRRGRRLVRQT